MLMRPVQRVSRRGVVGTVARTAVVAGTATAVVAGVSRHHRDKQHQGAEAQAYGQEHKQLLLGRNLTTHPRRTAPSPSRTRTMTRE